MEGKEYKPDENFMLRQIRDDIEQNMSKFKDPIVLGEMVYRLLEERENTNRILKTLMAKIESLEAKISSSPIEASTSQTTILADVDEQIMQFLKDCKKATAEEVRAKFNYKGKNAASARLNRLCDMGLLQKTQAGKKVYFFPK